jgi:hypothetical protein
MSDKWIDVKHSKPPFDERVLVTIAQKFGAPYVALSVILDSDPPHWLWLLRSETVTHWQPLPKPAKE